MKKQLETLKFNYSKYPYPNWLNWVKLVKFRGDYQLNQENKAIKIAKEPWIKNQGDKIDRSYLPRQETYFDNSIKRKIIKRKRLL